MKRTSLFALYLIATTQIFAAVGPVSVPARSGQSAAGNSLNPIIATDSRHVVFISHANNLVTNDNLSPVLDVFMHDPFTSNTVLVSVGANGMGGANADANCPSVSSNGQYVAFSSAASNLVSGDNNNASDVFLRELSVGVTRLISVSSGGGSPTDPRPTRNAPLSGNPLISADGRWVFFESRATNLLNVVTPVGGVNIYARDTWSNATVLITRDTNGLAIADASALAGITPDGRYVAFTTTNHSLIGGDIQTGLDVYLRDMQTGEIIQCSANASMLVGGAYDASFPTLSADGNSVAFNITALNSGFTYPALWERQSGTSRRLFTFAVSNTPPIISADGSAVAFEGSSNAFTQILLWERANNAVRVAHQKMLGNYLANATHVDALSADGRYMVFREWAVDAPYFAPAFVPAYHLFRKDLSTGTLELLSVKTNGSWSSGNFQFAAVSASPDGQVVAFDSTATDLAELDYNGSSDVFVRNIGSGTTHPVSQALPEREARTPQAYSFLGLNSISADGRFVVSTRFDDPSTYRDTNAWADVYVSDLWSNTSVAVSVNANLFDTNSLGGTIGQGTPIENTNAYERPIISADGSRIYAVQRAGVGPNDRSFVVGVASSNGVFAQEGLVSAVRSPFLSGAGNGSSFSPSTSSNGNLLVFTTTSTDLIADIEDSNGASDVLLRERVLQTNGFSTLSNRLISVSTSGGFGNGASSNGFISPDSRRVIFESRASNLTTNQTFGSLSLFARDWQLNQTYLVSIAPNGNPELGYQSGSAVFSGNSRYVAFLSADRSVVVHDLLTHTTVVADGSYGRSASLNHDGRYVAYAWRSNIFDSSFDQIYVRDLQSLAIDPVSVGTSGIGNGGSASPLISGDGRYVVFESKASNLVANDANGASDIFVRDRVLGVTMLLSSTGSGQPGNGPSSRPVMAADGRTVVFQSFASDLAGGDYNDKRDIFVVKLSGVDSDGDGMDDDWEVAYFGDKSRDGNGDFDHDGASDRAEFLAGTDPKNDGSVFRVISITPVGGSSRQLVWSGNPTRSYRAEFKDDLSSATWTPVAGTISWNGSVASITDTTTGSSAQRYYRAVRLP